MHRSSLAICAAFVACLAATPTRAAMITHVSTKGADSGTCATLATACRTFAYAQTKTDAGGEILALDAGDYGEVTITKSLAITGTVEGAGVYGNGANVAAIAVAAGPSDVVDLTGLTIDGQGERPYGIDSGSAGFVTIRKSSIRNISIRGVILSSAAAFVIQDVEVAHTGNDGMTILARGVVHRASVFATGSAGIAALSGLNVTISETTLSRNLKAVFSDARIRRSVVTGNQTGLDNLSGTESAGDNFIRDNTKNWINAPVLVGRQ